MLPNYFVLEYINPLQVHEFFLEVNKEVIEVWTGSPRQPVLIARLTGDISQHDIYSLNNWFIIRTHTLQSYHNILDFTSGASLASLYVVDKQLNKHA